VVIENVTSVNDGEAVAETAEANPSDGRGPDPRGGDHGVAVAMFVPVCFHPENHRAKSNRQFGHHDFGEVSISSINALTLSRRSVAIL
jgi:hypothetical protein